MKLSVTEDTFMIKKKQGGQGGQGDKNEKEKHKTKHEECCYPYCHPCFHFLTLEVPKQNTKAYFFRYSILYDDLETDRKL